jgi:hypothetical protein
MHASLNRVYKVIWCKVRLAWVAVSELAVGGGKVQSSTRQLSRANREVETSKRSGIGLALKAPVSYTHLRAHETG